MNIEKATSRWKSRTVLAAALLLGAWTAQACTPHTAQMGPSMADKYWVYEGIGKPLTGWGQLMTPDGIGELFLYQGCTGGSSYQVEHIPDLPYWGIADDGAAVFEIAENVGVEFRVSRGLEGFGASHPVGSGGVTLNVSGGANIRMRLWYRYIAIKDVSAGVNLYPGGYTWTFNNLDDATLSSSRSNQGETIYKYVPPPPPSCWFVRAPAKTVAMPHTTVGMLERDGSGPQSAFNWSFNCISATGAAVEYSPGTSSTDPKTGKMAIEKVAGGAEGVELEVRRSTTSGGRKNPVEFGKSYARDTSGSEYLEVRYVPTGDELKPGPANGSLKVNLDFY